MDAGAVAARPLRLVERVVCGADDLVGRVEIRSGQGRSNRHAQSERGVADDDRPRGERVAGALGELEHRRVVPPRCEDRELLAAPAREGVAAAQDARQPSRDCSQDGVARQVAVLVVDLLGVVEIEQQDRGA